MREYSFARLIPIIPTPSPKTAQQQQHKIVGTRTLNFNLQGLGPSPKGQLWAIS